MFCLACRCLIHVRHARLIKAAPWPLPFTAVSKHNTAAKNLVITGRERPAESFNAAGSSVKHSSSTNQGIQLTYQSVFICLCLYALVFSTLCESESETTAVCICISTRGSAHLDEEKQHINSLTCLGCTAWSICWG